MAIHEAKSDVQYGEGLLDAGKLDSTGGGYRRSARR
jgi:hypothetical protein